MLDLLGTNLHRRGDLASGHLRERLRTPTDQPQRAPTSSSLVSKKLAHMGSFRESSVELGGRNRHTTRTFPGSFGPFGVRTGVFPLPGADAEDMRFAGVRGAMDMVPVECLTRGKPDESDAAAADAVLGLARRPLMLRRAEPAPAADAGDVFPRAPMPRGLLRDRLRARGPSSGPSDRRVRVLRGLLGELARSMDGLRDARRRLRAAADMAGEDAVSAAAARRLGVVASPPRALDGDASGVEVFSGGGVTDGGDPAVEAAVAVGAAPSEASSDVTLASRGDVLMARYGVLRRTHTPGGAAHITTVT